MSGTGKITGIPLVVYSASILAVFGAALAVEFSGSLTPPTVGFHLYDPKFAYPKGTETISQSALIAIVVVVGVFVVAMQWLRGFSEISQYFFGPLTYIGGFSICTLGGDLIKVFAGL
jgi:hypothetical protein